MREEARIILKKCPVSGFGDEIDPGLDAQINLLKKLGISWLEFRSGDGTGVADYTLAQAAETRKKLDQNGIRISAVGSPIGKIGIREDFKPHMEKLEHVAEVAGILGSRYIRMFSFYIPEGERPEQYRDSVFERVEEMIKLAERRNLVLLHENEKEIYGDTASRCLELLERFAGPNFGCTFDFANFVQCGQDTVEAYELLRPYISYIHVKDAVAESGTVVLPGKGDGHLPEIFRRLEEDGYEGFLSMEPHLVDFAGFALLEKSAKQKKSGDGAMAFRNAYEALEEILRGR